jgi:hypothetical protein
MTGMYNVLEKLRAADSVVRGSPDPAHAPTAGLKNAGKHQAGKPDLHVLTPKEQEIHEQGLVSVLKQIHDDLDTAVADAYGWPADLTDSEILERLVALNHQRAAEERRGLVRWLRPEFQNPSGQKQSALDVDAGQAQPDEPDSSKKKPSKSKPAQQKWPKTLSAQAAAVHAALVTLPAGATAEEVSKTFGRKNDKRTELVEEILETLETLGKAREISDGRFVAM